MCEICTKMFEKHRDKEHVKKKHQGTQKENNISQEIWENQNKNNKNILKKNQQFLECKNRHKNMQNCSTQSSLPPICFQVNCGLTSVVDVGFYHWDE